VIGNDTLVEMWDTEYDQKMEGIQRLEMFQDGHKIHKEKVYPKFQMAVEKHSSDGAAVAWIMYNHLKEACIQGLFEYFDDWSLHDCDSSEEVMLEGFLGFLTAYPNYVSEYQECWFDSVTFYIKEFIPSIGTSSLP
jgi:hypothetical protein